MQTKKRRSRLIWLSGFLILAAAGLFLYWKLGGFNKPEICKVQAPSYRMLGKHYKGRLNDKDFSELFKVADSLSKKYQGTSAALYYNNPAEEEGKVNAFVGTLSDNIPEETKGFTVKTIESRPVLRGVLNAYYLVVPVKVYPVIEKYARRNNLSKTDTMVLEKYPDRWHYVVEVPLKGQQGKVN